MNRQQFLLNRIFAALFFAAFLWVICLFFTRGSFFAVFWQPSKSSTNLIAAGGAIAVVAFIFAIFKLGFNLRPARARLTASTLLAAAFVIYIVMQIIFAKELKVPMGLDWDFGIVANAAAKHVVFGRPVRGYYFNMFPNNIPLLLLYIGVFKFSAAVGYTDFVNVGILMNIISIDISILLLYFTVKKIKNSRAAAIIAVLVMMLTLPLLSYIAIYYTDTLTLIYPILSLYLWTCAKHNFKSDKNKKAFIQTGLLVLSCVAGGLLKISVIIVLVAIVADALLNFKIKKSAVIAGVVIALFVSLFLPSYHAMMNAPILPKKNIEEQVPWTHWVMMGLHGNGWYNNDDYQMVLSVPGGERDEFIKQEIARRVDEYGAAGMADHLSEKNAFVWADGTYFSPMKVRRDRVSDSPLDAFLWFEGDNFAYYGYYCQFFILALILGFLIGAWYLFREKEFSSKLLPFALSIFGLFLFQMLWEARSRYLLNFIPVFIVLAVCGYEKLYNWLAVNFKNGNSRFSKIPKTKSR